MRRWLRPNALSVFVMVILLVVWLLFTSLQTMAAGEAGDVFTTWTVGNPVVLRIVSDVADAQLMNRDVEVRWAHGLAVLLLAHAAGLLVAAALRRLTGVPRLALVLSAVCLGITVAALPTALLVSKSYWGYFLSRPDLDPRIAEEAAGVVAIARVTTGGGTGEGGEGRGEHGRGRAGGVGPLRSEASLDLPAAQHRCARYPYECLEERVIVALARRGLLETPKPQFTERELVAILTLVQESACLVEPDPGYGEVEELHGMAARVIDRNGDRLLIVALRSGPVSEDHHPYYELLYREGDGASQLLSATTFFYDVAGFVGCEWYVAWLAFSLLAMAAGLPVTLLALGLRNLLRHLIRARSRGATRARDAGASSGDHLPAERA